MERLGGVVLAAGVSSRMGQFKPLMKIGDKTMIERVICGMQNAGAQKIVVVTGYNHEKIEALLKSKNVIFVYNENFAQTQMLDSVKIGLERISGFCKKVIICPADVPLVDPETIKKMASADGCFIRPVHGEKHGHPVIADGNILGRICGYQGEGGLSRAISRCGITVTDVEVDDEGAFIDADTMKNYEQLVVYYNKVFAETPQLGIDIKISLREETLFCNQQTIQLLELADITGSLQAACKCMHISYSGGTTAVRKLENSLGFKVLEQSRGGIGGGNSKFTDSGWRFVNTYKVMSEKITEFAQKTFDEMRTDFR